MEARLLDLNDKLFDYNVNRCSNEFIPPQPLPSFKLLFFVSEPNSHITLL